jgi:hypothetical protein
MPVSRNREEAGRIEPRRSQRLLGAIVAVAKSFSLLFGTQTTRRKKRAEENSEERRIFCFFHSCSSCFSFFKGNGEPPFSALLTIGSKSPRIFHESILS